MYIPKEQVKNMSNTTGNSSNKSFNNNYVPSKRGKDIEKDGGKIRITTKTVSIQGILEILPDYGVIRQEPTEYYNGDLPKDVYISQSQIKKFRLRMGDEIGGRKKAPPI